MIQADLQLPRRLQRREPAVRQRPAAAAASWTWAATPSRWRAWSPASRSGKNFAEPIEVKGVGHLGQTGVDEWAVAVLKFPGDIVAQVATGVAVNQENAVRIFGTEGNISSPRPGFPPAKAARQDHRQVTRDKEPRKIDDRAPTSASTPSRPTPSPRNIDRRQAPSRHDLGRHARQHATLDRWRESIGLVYDRKSPRTSDAHRARRPLAVRRAPDMKYGRIPGLDKPVSRLVMGVRQPAQYRLRLAVMFDDFFERGGNAFDTAYVYGGGQSRAGSSASGSRTAACATRSSSSTRAPTRRSAPQGPHASSCTRASTACRPTTWTST